MRVLHPPGCLLFASTGATTLGTEPRHLVACGGRVSVHCDSETELEEKFQAVCVHVLPSVYT